VFERPRASATDPDRRDATSPDRWSMNVAMKAGFPGFHRKAEFNGVTRLRASDKVNGHVVTPAAESVCASVRPGDGHPARAGIHLPCRNFAGGDDHRGNLVLLWVLGQEMNAAQPMRGGSRGSRVWDRHPPFASHPPGETRDPPAQFSSARWLQRGRPHHAARIGKKKSRNHRDIDERHPVLVGSETASK
jgi:hypothetical protein